MLHLHGNSRRLEDILAEGEKAEEILEEIREAHRHIKRSGGVAYDWFGRTVEEILERG